MIEQMGLKGVKSLKVPGVIDQIIDMSNNPDWNNIIETKACREEPDTGT